MSHTSASDAELLSPSFPASFSFRISSWIVSEGFSASFFLSFATFLRAPCAMSAPSIAHHARRLVPAHVRLDDVEDRAQPICSACQALRGVSGQDIIAPHTPYAHRLSQSTTCSPLNQASPAHQASHNNILLDILASDWRRSRSLKVATPPHSLHRVCHWRGLCCSTVKRCVVSRECCFPVEPVRCQQTYQKWGGSYQLRSGNPRQGCHHPSSRQELSPRSQ